MLREFDLLAWIREQYLSTVSLQSGASASFICQEAIDIAWIAERTLKSMPIGMGQPDVNPPTLIISELTRNVEAYKKEHGDPSGNAEVALQKIIAKIETSSG